MVELDRLSIEKLKPEWCGWEYLTELIDQVPSTDSLDASRDQAYLACLFELGCRATEALALKDTNFMFTNPGLLTCVDIPILKRYKKLSHHIEFATLIPEDVSPSHRHLWIKTEQGYQRKRYETEKKEEIRRLELPLDEPLMNYLVPYIKTHREVLFPRSYSHFYHIVTQLNTHQDKYPKGLHLPPHAFLHWFRSLRACQLAAEYKFTLHELVDFFEWKDLKTALTYSHLAGVLTQKMVTAPTTWRPSP